MKATTIRLVRWFIILDVGTVDISHPRLTNYTCVRRPAVLCTYGRLLFVMVDGWMGFRMWMRLGREGAGSTSYMLVVLSFAVLDVRPPSFSFSLIRTSNFSAVDSSNECSGGDAGLLGLFRAALGEVLHQDPAKRDRRLSMPHSDSNQVNSLSYL